MEGDKVIECKKELQECPSFGGHSCIIGIFMDKER